MLENDLKKLIKILEDSKIDELEVSTFWGRQNIRIRKSPPNNHQKIETSNSLNKEKVQEKTTILPQLEPETIITESSTATPTDKTISEDITVNKITIKAPLVGTFYRSSKPDTPPFISEGDVIMEGQIICIIEAMKIFNEIEADTSGKVIKILIKDATPVEYDQDLFVIAPT